MQTVSNVAIDAIRQGITRARVNCAPAGATALVLAYRELRHRYNHIAAESQRLLSRLSETPQIVPLLQDYAREALDTARLIHGELLRVDTDSVVAAKTSITALPPTVVDHLLELNLAQYQQLEERLHCLQVSHSMLESLDAGCREIQSDECHSLNRFTNLGRRMVVETAAIQHPGALVFALALPPALRSPRFSSPLIAEVCSPALDCAWLLALAVGSDRNWANDLPDLMVAALLQNAGMLKLHRRGLSPRGETRAGDPRTGSSHQAADHAMAGAAMLSVFSGSHSGICELVGVHHERVDGTGTPRGLHHSQILPTGRLIATATRFIELVHAQHPHPSSYLARSETPRPDAPQIVSRAAAELLLETQQGEWDPRMTDLLLARLRPALPSLPGEGATNTQRTILRRMVSRVYLADPAHIRPGTSSADASMQLAGPKFLQTRYRTPRGTFPQTTPQDGETTTSGDASGD